MDFVDGQNLSKHGFKDGKNERIGRDKQKRRRSSTGNSSRFPSSRGSKFPAITALGFDGREPSNPNPTGVRVCHRPLTIEIAGSRSSGEISSE